MSLITLQEALRADEIADELQGLGQWARWRAVPKTALREEQAAAASQRACGYEAGALRQAGAQRTLAENALAQAARVIPDAQAQRKELLARAQSYNAAAKDWEDRAAAFGRQCRGVAKETSI